MMGSDKERGTEPRTLIGHRVCLRPLGKEDLAHIREWYDDAELKRLTGEVSPMSEPDCERFLEQAYADDRTEWFVVVTKKSGRAIGDAGLLSIDRAFRTTDLSVIIGEKAEWGKGYGTETALLLLDHAFRRLGLHRVAISVVGFNDRALRFWEKIGFKKEGVERDGYYYDGKYYDFVMMSILEDEFRELHGGEAVRCQTRAIREEGGEE